MRIIDVHCYPNTREWIACQQPYVDALATYWNRPWVPKSEEEVVQEFTVAGVEAVLVALDLETTIGTPPCSNDFVSAMQKRHAKRIIQSWPRWIPLKGREPFSMHATRSRTWECWDSTSTRSWGISR